MAVCTSTPKGEDLEETGAETPAPGTLAALFAAWRWMKDVSGQTDEEADTEVVDLATMKLFAIEDMIMATPSRTVEDVAIKVIVAHSDGDGLSDGPFWHLLITEANALAGGVA